MHYVHATFDRIQRRSLSHVCEAQPKA